MPEESSVTSGLRERANEGVNQNLPLVVLAGAFWLLTLLRATSAAGEAREFLVLAQGLAMLLFVILHGARRYGAGRMLVWFGMTFVITWFLETVSIGTGFPFGHYHYTGLMGPRFGPVPFSIMFAYYAVGYLAWTVGSVLLGELGSGISRRNRILLPVVASWVMVMWDFCFDPIKSTVEGAWLWRDGGAYWGVPLSNFAGWFVTVWLSFGAFALFLMRRAHNRPLGQGKTYWLLGPVMYLGMALEYLLNPLVKAIRLDIYQSMALGAMMTMVFVGMLAILLASRLESDKL